MFRVGQKVVCIDASGVNGRGLVKGRVYVVSYVHYDGCIRVGFDPVIHCGYSDARFRPIVSRPTSIAVFEKILRKVNAPGRVTA